ncbi:MAG: glycosyltransferase family 2 protein [Vitreoscilla sp.]|nr:glycosyltransferase family 2 protein [Vitreoscilla sp.]
MHSLTPSSTAPATPALPPVHIAIVQPAGYVHSMGFLDQARYFRHQFRRMGASVSIAKNRLREDAVNFIFGAHLGVPADWAQRHCCVVVNLEQLGPGGASVSPDYMNLLRRSAVVDYEPENLPHYAANVADVPVVPFLYAPYLDDGQTLPLAERPIDLLFFGSMNPRRQAYIAKVEAAGAQVTLFDHAIYGDERDQYIRLAKAVLNCHHYESSRFEQARAFHCLSLGTPVISERTASTRAPQGFDEAVFWLEDGEIAPFFGQQFNTSPFFDAAEGKLAAFRATDPLQLYADLLAFAAGVFQVRQPQTSALVWQPQQICTPFPEGYRAGWLNIAADGRAGADLRLDLTRPLPLPTTGRTPDGGQVLLQPGGAQLVHLNAEGVNATAVPALLRNALALLNEDGVLKITTPIAEAAAASATPETDPAWLRHAAAFWTYGALEHRFEKLEHVRERQQLSASDSAAAHNEHLSLKKVAVTIKERTLARARCADFGGLADDLPVDAPASTATPQVAAAAVPDPDLTVVCVSYKRYENIPILIHSFLAQTLQSYKLLIIHDGYDAKMDGILSRYKAEYPSKVDYLFTEQRYNDWGHSLRDMGIGLAETEYILITNDDNYYAPKFLELMLPDMKAKQADIAMCNMVHSHHNPGLRPQPSYMPFETRPERGSLDMGCFIARTALAQQVGFRDKGHDGDATYFEDLVKAAGNARLLKVERTLFVHN